MITIEQEGFKMVQSSAGPFFDLYLPKTINKGKPNERTEMVLSGYGHSFEYCIKLLITIRLSKSESYSINEYMQAYVKEVNEIKKLIKIESK